LVGLRVIHGSLHEAGMADTNRLTCDSPMAVCAATGCASCVSRAGTGAQRETSDRAHERRLVRQNNFFCT
jgi:hypothetical protein